ncbi:anthranilate phosphoribosyltransferase [Fictibacillus macauensis ZFHKF-1]|uniref:Anthranilate phosphoribosyltransferase n=1 Tax=Fictibacillus macauensis ZFHKF-1 TaxID=1196324 RepID=I8UIE6_9BACL|nr:anthranilate phosphoribosyltransferase [Fictibacillus macauensis]EIT86593.1 anthranilate phosphoribosyltransferase [Fictibacillus macauensis ZFHKF-1]
MITKEFLQKARQKDPFTKQEAYELMTLVLSGNVPKEELALLLTMLHKRGETVEEMVGFVSAIMAQTNPISIPTVPLLDTCGTGGDGASTFNISTASSFVLASTGLQVTKHGNRAVTSTSGSSDVLHALGISASVTEADIKRQLAQHSLAFLYAPNHHPALRHAAATRASLPFRTVFNVLGPLINPTLPTHQLIGAYNLDAARKMAETLSQIGKKRALIVTGEDGLDECSVFARTHFFDVQDGTITTFSKTPEEVGLTRGHKQDILISSKEASAGLVYDVLHNVAPASAIDIVSYNSGAAFYVAGVTETIAEGIQYAREVISSQQAAHHLAQMQEKGSGYYDFAANS